MDDYEKIGKYDFPTIRGKLSKKFVETYRHTREKRRVKSKSSPLRLGKLVFFKKNFWKIRRGNRYFWDIFFE